MFLTKGSLQNHIVQTGSIKGKLLSGLTLLVVHPLKIDNDGQIVKKSNGQVLRQSDGLGYE